MNQTSTDGPEEARDARGAVALDGEEPDDDHHGDGQDVGLEDRCDQLQALEGRQHGDGGRDGRVAVEQGGARHAEQRDDIARLAQCTLGKGHEGEDAALALVVGAQQQQHVFAGDDEDQRPEDQRQDAEDDVAAWRARRAMPGRRHHGLAEGVEGAGADVAIDDADGADEQAPEARLGMTMAVVARLVDAGRLRGAGVQGDCARDIGRVRRTGRRIMCHRIGTLWDGRVGAGSCGSASPKRYAAPSTCQRQSGSISG